MKTERELAEILITHTGWQHPDMWGTIAGYNRKESEILSHDFRALEQESRLRFGITRPRLHKYVRLVIKYIENGDPHVYLISGILSEVVRGEIPDTEIDEKIALIRLEN